MVIVSGCSSDCSFLVQMVTIPISIPVEFFCREQRRQDSQSMLKNGDKPTLCIRFPTYAAYYDHYNELLTAFCVIYDRHCYRLVVCNCSRNARELLCEVFEFSARGSRWRCRVSSVRILFLVLCVPIDLSNKRQ